MNSLKPQAPSRKKLPRTARLRKSSRFELVKRKGRRFQAHILSITLLSSPETAKQTPPYRFGLTVSRKVHLKANKRNLLKRRLKEIIREVRGKLTGHGDLVITPRAESIPLDFKTLRSTLLKLFKDARILPNTYP